MPEFLKWLVGLRDVSPGATEGDWRIEWQALPHGAAALGCIALALIGVAGIWWLYRREGRELSRGLRIVFLVLRSLTLAAVVAMLFDMVLVIERHEQIPSQLLVLVDGSESTSLSDPYSGVDEALAQRLLTRLNWKTDDAKADLARLRDAKRFDLALESAMPLAEQLADGRQVSLYRFDSKVEAVESWEKLKEGSPRGPQTSIGDAITQALANHRGRPLAGVLIWSDGQSNGGEDPRKVAVQAGKDGVPIFAVTLGTEQGPSNVRLADLETNPIVFVRDRMTLSAVVTSQGLQGQGAVVRLERRHQNDGEWTEVAQQPIVLAEEGTVQRVEFDYTPENVGQIDFRVTVADAGKELTEDDNSATQTVRVVRQRIHVLLIAGYPSPEVQFMRNALLRDKLVEFSSWLQSAGTNYEQIGTRPLRRLPANQDELNQYDVVVLFDPNLTELGSNWSEMLTKFVGDAGGGLVYIAGEINTSKMFSAAAADPSGLGDTGWVRMLPVVSEPGLYSTSVDVRLSSQEPWNLELTPDGDEDLIFQFTPDVARNREILASLPGMYWHYPVTRAKPGATVLARHGDQRMTNSFGRHVLLAMQRYGPGRTAFLGFDSTYRWRYLHEEYFDGFWARLMDRVGRSKALGGRYPFTLATDRNVYRVGDRVTVRVQMLAGQEESGLASQLQGDVEIPGQEPMQLELEPSPSNPEVLEASFSVDKGGPYMVRVAPGAIGGGDSGVRPATLPFRVEPPRQEVDNPRLNRALLEDIARASGGRVLSLDETDQIPGAIRIKQVDRVLQYREELWDAPIWAFLIVMLLTCEWVLRKIYRMA